MYVLIENVKNDKEKCWLFQGNTIIEFINEFIKNYNNLDLYKKGYYIIKYINQNCVNNHNDYIMLKNDMIDFIDINEYLETNYIEQFLYNNRNKNVKYSYHKIIEYFK